MGIETEALMLVIYKKERGIWRCANETFALRHLVPLILGRIKLKH